ncbi:MAG: MFS transporter [Patescibacteria group bacterium]
MERITVILRRNVLRTGKGDSGFLQLFISKRLLQGAAAALVGIFLPIYIYTATDNQFWVVGGFYAVASLCYALLLPLAMHLTNKIGFSRTLVLGGVFSIAQYALLYYAQQELIWYFLPAILLVFILFRLFHWVPFHVDFTLFTKEGERGRDVSLTFATIAFMGVVGPILAGFIIANSSYEVLFGVVTVLLVVSTISYSFVPETDAFFEWRWYETFTHLFSKKFRGLTTGAFANGAEIAVTMVAWPIFLFELLDGNVLEIGALSTVIVGVTIALQFFVGRHLDKAKGNSIKTLQYGSVFYAIGWLLKIFVLSTVQVFLVGLYHNVTRIFTKTPFTALLYDMSGDQSRYVDEMTVIREMADHLGRVISLVLIIGLTFVLPINYSFVIAVAASLALNLIHQLQT